MSIVIKKGIVKAPIVVFRSNIHSNIECEINTHRDLDKFKGYISLLNPSKKYRGYEDKELTKLLKQIEEEAGELEEKKRLKAIELIKASSLIAALNIALKNCSACCRITAYVRFTCKLRKIDYEILSTKKEVLYRIDGKSIKYINNRFIEL